MLKKLYKPILKDMEEVEKLISLYMTKEPSEKILKINNHCLASKGKRLRPAMVLFSYYGHGGKGNQESLEIVYKIAAAIELIHMASLIHDDVIDHASERHNSPTVNKNWGDEVAVVQGVYLYSVSLQLIADAGNIEVLSNISQTVKTLCQGELIQILGRESTEKSISVYLDILKKKTGVLFSLACKAGAILAKAEKQKTSDIEKFGENLGLVFQIADDYMDIMGDAKTLGKVPGQDFDLGEITLPLLYLIEECTSKEERQKLESLIESKDINNLEELREKIKNSKALSKTKALAGKYLDEAMSIVKLLPKSSYQKSLVNLVGFIEKRAFPN